MTEINEPDPDTFVPLYLYIDDFVPEPLPEEKPKDDDEDHDRRGSTIIELGEAKG